LKSPLILVTIVLVGIVTILYNRIHTNATKNFIIERVGYK
jgi:hypothetical protein